MLKAQVKKILLKIGDNISIRTALIDKSNIENKESCDCFCCIFFQPKIQNGPRKILNTLAQRIKDGMDLIVENIHNGNNAESIVEQLINTTTSAIDIVKDYGEPKIIIKKTLTELLQLQTRLQIEEGTIEEGTTVDLIY